MQPGPSHPRPEAHHAGRGMRPHCPADSACMQMAHLRANGTLGTGAIFEGSPTAVRLLSSAQIEPGHPSFWRQQELPEQP